MRERTSGRAKGNEKEWRCERKERKGEGERELKKRGRDDCRRALSGVLFAGKCKFLSLISLPWLLLSSPLPSPIFLPPSPSPPLLLSTLSPPLPPPPPPSPRPLASGAPSSSRRLAFSRHALRLRGREERREHTGHSDLGATRRTTMSGVANYE